MKSRILDHIDLRVKDFQRAMKFYGKLLPALGFSCDRSDETWGTFYSVGGDKPSEFLDSPRTDNINRTAPGSHFGRTPAKE